MSFVSRKLSRSVNLSQEVRRFSVDNALRYAEIFDNEQGIIFQATSEAVPPSRDFYQVKVICGRVILTRWYISHAMAHPKSQPEDKSVSYEYFLESESFHDEILSIFGREILDKLESYVLGEWDLLQRVPDKALRGICLFLDLKSLVSLCLTSKKMNQLCGCDEIWKIIYMRYSYEYPTEKDLTIIKNIGWKKHFFITNHATVYDALHQSGKGIGGLS